MQNFTFRMAIILIALFLFNFSCQDHVAPLQLETLSVKANTQQKCGLLFPLRCVSRGDAEITEYGVVYSAFGAGGPLTDNPTIENSKKAICELPLKTGDEKNGKGEACTNEIYYRTYAILSNGSIIYGNLLHFRIT